MSKVYYKATRPDGFDFWSQSINYAELLKTGKRTSIKPKTDFKTCSDTVYHASDFPSETLIGGSWPCRLFEVSGKPAVQKEYKFGFRSLRVVREIPAWKALGPNGEAIVRLIDQAKNVTKDQAIELVKSWYAAKYAARYAARDAARDAAGDAARNAAWYAAKYAAWDAARYAAGDAAGYAARYAARNAAEALIAHDLISEEHFRTLAEPWIEVIGDPRGAQ